MQPAATQPTQTQNYYQQQQQYAQQYAQQQAQYAAQQQAQQQQQQYTQQVILLNKSRSHLEFFAFLKSKKKIAYVIR